MQITHSVAVSVLLCISFIGLLTVFVLCVCFYRQVQHSHQTEADLKTSEEQYKALTEAVPVGIFRGNATGECVYVNQKWCQLTGYSAAAAMGKGWLQTVHPDDCARMTDAWTQMATKKHPTQLEFRIQQPDGTVKWVYVQVASEQDTDQQFVGYVGTLSDIDDRKQSELALKKSEAQSRAILAALPDFIVRVGADGVYREFIVPEQDHPCASLIHFTGESISGTLPSETAHRHRHHLQRALHTDELQIYEQTMHIGDRTQEKEIRVIKSGADEALFIVRDITNRKLAEAALRKHEQHFRNIAANIPGVIVQHSLRADGSKSLLYVSSSCYELWEIEAESVVEDSQAVWDMVTFEDQLAIRRSLRISAETLQPWSCQWQIRTPSGQRKWLHAVGRPERQKNGDVVWDTLVLDISDRKRAESALAKSEARYRKVVETQTDFILRLLPDTTITFANKSLCQALATSLKAIVGQRWSDFASRDSLQTNVLDYVAALSPQHPRFVVEKRDRRANGDIGWTHWLNEGIFDESGQLVEIQSVGRNITRLKQIEQDLRERKAQLKHDALHDGLTGLANRNLLLKRLERSLKQASRNLDHQFAVLFLDLDHFKVINDSLGHIAGDELLLAIANLLKEIVRESDLAARLGGDEFVILLEKIQDINEAERIAERILTTLKAPLDIGGQEIFIDASIGIVIGTAEYFSAEELLRDSDVAMYRAKQRGRGCYILFDPTMHLEAVQRLEMENDLRKALLNDEFVLHYQPIVLLETQTIEGFEALIRWQHPQRGCLFPKDFIDIAEETGLIAPLGEWVLRRACQQLAYWRTQFPDRLLKVSVNLSVKQLKDSLLDTLENVRSAYSLLPNSLILEITESMLVKNVETTASLLAQVREKNIGVSIDDFGMGYSSLSYLHQLPVDTLKIDRSFVSPIQPDARNRVISESIITLSNLLGLGAIAEGIETAQQLEWLKKLGCKKGQGYFFSPPVPAEQATQKLLETI